MEKLSIIDSYSSKDFHEICNAAVLVECLSIAAEITYFCGRGALRSIEYLTGGKKFDNVSFKTIPVVERNSKIHTVLRLFLSMVINCLLLITIKRNNCIFYNYNNVFSLPMINFLNRSLKKKIAILCHGEFETFNKNIAIKHNFFWRYYYNLLNTFFTRQNTRLSPGIIFFVLGDNIKLNLESHVSAHIYKKIYSIDHSFVNAQLPVKKDKYTSKINLGMIGQVRKDKNIGDIILFAEKIASEISGGKVDFSIIGAASINADELKAAGITLSGEGKNFLSREEYDCKVADLDYALFFYNKDMYQYTASGPLLDALYAEKPIIALRNNYIGYMFNKYGEFGLLLDSIDEMAELIKEIAAGKTLPLYDFERIKDQLRPERVALQLKAAFEEEGF